MPLHRRSEAGSNRHRNVGRQHKRIAGPPVSNRGHLRCPLFNVWWLFDIVGF